MKYKEFGDRTNPTVILLHGEGLSWWSFTDIIPLLETEYHIVTPVIDGHGEDGATPFLSIQDSAQKLVRYIDTNYQGKVLAICGLSLGGQIAAEVLSRRAGIAEYAIIQSASVVPRKYPTRVAMLYGLLYRLNRQDGLPKYRQSACVKTDRFERTIRLCRLSRLSDQYCRPYRYAARHKARGKVLIVIG